MRLTKKLICEFIYNSNAIEGIEDTKEDIDLAYDMFKKSSVKLDAAFRIKHRSIFNTLEAIEYIKTRKDQTPDLDSIRELHRITMDQLMPMKDWGCFRAIHVTVGGHNCPSPELLIGLLAKLVESWDQNLTLEFPEMFKSGMVIPNKNSTKVNIISPDDYDTPFLKHAQFEVIHPFSDGNGRTGRLLHMWDCMLHNYKYYMIRFSERELYYQMLRLYRAFS